jgi:uncharacterized protein (TIGR02145 family)
LIHINNIIVNLFEIKIFPSIRIKPNEYKPFKFNQMKKSFTIQICLFILTGILFMVSNGCKKSSTPGQAPEVSTSALSNITQTTATGGGKIVTDEGSSVTACGVCWSTVVHPTLADNTTKDLNNAGSFTSNITGLTQNATYYIRAYATNSNGTGYGNELTFSTLGPAPAVTTSAITDITQTAATSGGNVVNDGGSAVTARGVCWNTALDPTIANSKTTDGTGTGGFTSNMTGLTANTTYYVRAYSTSANGTGYGAEMTFTTLGPVPTVSTSSVTAITQTTATGGGNVTSDGGSAVIVRGVCWNTVTDPTTANTKTVDGTGTGNFTSNINGLTMSTTYYLRAYAITANGTGYGSDVTFTTLGTPPAVTTTVITGITQTTATGGGNVTSDGGSSVTARGVCWSTAIDPTLANSYTTDGTGTGSFTSNITGLTSGTTYYVRAYATSANGTGYGADMNFTTQLATITDIDGNIYHQVVIGTQTWLVENLKTTRYNDGSSIPLVTDPNAWISLSSDAYCWPENDGSNITPYGAMYNWYAVNTGKLALTGWHVPTDDDWNTLINYAGGTSVAGGNLKETGTTYWQPPNTGATDEFGFSAVPAGYRSYTNGSFVNFTLWGIYWSATTQGGSAGRVLLENTTAAIDFHDPAGVYTFGFSVRCIKNSK